MQVFGRELHLHSMAVHFTNALYPVAVFFLALSFVYRREACLFAYQHLMVLAVVSTPVSFATGVIEWKRRYKGARIRIFRRKLGFGLALWGLGTLCALWYVFFPLVLEGGGLPRAAFVAANLATVPIVVYLGALGGRLVFGGAH